LNSTLVQAVSVVKGCQTFGGDEVVAQSLINWVFNGQKGSICLKVRNSSGEELRCVLKLGKMKIQDGVGTVRITKTDSKSQKKK